MVLFDLWGVGKRYLNSDHFVTKRDFSGQFAQRPVDRMILEDPDIDYRVLDISVNTFNDAFPSYWHRCIGGYSPAKLQRYQDLIERYITPEINDVIGTVNEQQTIQGTEENLPYLPAVSMLNGKYIIVGDEYAPVVNRYAFGNAWFVDGFVPAGTPDDEIELLGEVDLHTTAVIGDDFSWARDAFPASTGDSSPVILSGSEESDFIQMTHYAPNELRYTYRTSRERAVIFSEVYYPSGWTLTSRHMDGDSGSPTELPLFRADWLLRGAILPAGEGELVMRFDPPSYRTGEALSRASSVTLLLLLVLSSRGLVIAARKQD